MMAAPAPTFQMSTIAVASSSWNILSALIVRPAMAIPATLIVTMVLMGLAMVAGRMSVIAYWFLDTFLVLARIG